MMEHERGCPSFAGAALMNGKPLENLTTGGIYGSIDSFLGIPIPGDSCVPPEWSLPTWLPVGEVTEFAIQDKTGSLTMGVANVGGSLQLRHCEPTPDHCWLR